MITSNLILQSHDVINAYDLFQFCKMYDKVFLLKVKVINSKSFLSPWMTKGLLKSSRKKQKLYEKYLKHKTYKNEIITKTVTIYLKKIKKRSKVNYYAKLLEKKRKETLEKRVTYYFIASNNQNFHQN